MKQSKLYTSLIYGYNLMMLIIFVLMFSLSLQLWFNYLTGSIGELLWIRLLVFLIGYSFILVVATIDYRKNKSLKLFQINKRKRSKETEINGKLVILAVLGIFLVFTAAVSYYFLICIGIFLLILSIILSVFQKKNKQIVYIEMNWKLLLIISWILFIIMGRAIFCGGFSGFNIIVFVSLMMLLILYSSIILFFMNIKRIPKMDWTIRDCIMILFGFIISIVTAVVFFVNFNSIGDSILWRSTHVIFVPSYIEFVILPITAINIYNLIRINENNKKEKLNNN